MNSAALLALAMALGRDDHGLQRGCVGFRRCIGQRALCLGLRCGGEDACNKQGEVPAAHDGWYVDHAVPCIFSGWMRECTARARVGGGAILSVLFAQ